MSNNQALVDYFNSILSEKGIFIHNINNSDDTRIPRGTVVEGVFRTTPGQINKSLGANSRAKVGNFSMQFMVPASDLDLKNELIDVLNDFAANHHGVNINLENIDEQYNVFFDGDAQEGGIVLKGVDKCIVINLTGSFSCTSAFLSSHNTELSIGLSNTDPKYPLEGILSIIPTMANNILKDVIINAKIANSTESKLRISETQRAFMIKGYLVTSDAFSLLYKAFMSVDDAKKMYYIDFCFKDSLGTELIKIANLPVKIQTLTFSFLANNYAQIDLTLVETYAF